MFYKLKVVVWSLLLQLHVVLFSDGKQQLQALNFSAGCLRNLLPGSAPISLQ